MNHHTDVCLWIIGDLEQFFDVFCVRDDVYFSYTVWKLVCHKEADGEREREFKTVSMLQINFPN